MTDEVIPDKGGVPLSEELIIARFFRTALGMLDDLRGCDEMLEEHPRHAVHRCVPYMLDFVMCVGVLMRDLGFLPHDSRLPGDSLARLIMALSDLNKGITNPVLARSAETSPQHGRHILSENDQIARIRPAMMMELLRGDNYSVPKAAKTVADILKGDPILADIKGAPAGAITRWWRVLLKGDPNSVPTTLFTSAVAEAKAMLKARGGTAADFIKLAPGLLGSTAKKRRKRL